MTERERIEALFAAGKITRQEADILLSALDEGEGAARQADQYLEAAAPQPQPTPQGGYRPEGLRWVRVRLMAGELEARLDPGLTAPVVEGGSTEVREVGQDLEVIPNLPGGSFLGGILGNMHIGAVELRLPPGWGLDLDSKAAHVEVEGVAYLKGRVSAGNIELGGVQGLDLEVSAGNVEGSLLLTDGSHRLKVSMGNADLDLIQGSSVEAKAVVHMGNVNLRGFERTPNGSGTRLRLGDGRASLDVSVRMGNLEIKAK